MQIKEGLVRKLTVMGIAGMLAGGVAGAAEWFVSPEGEDTNPGTKELPLRSLKRARDRLREASPARGESRVVTLRGGVYRMNQALVLEARDAGTAEAAVVFRAFPGEIPILSGGMPVGEWKVSGADSRVWVAELPPGTRSRDFFVRGDRRPRARSGSWSGGEFTTTDEGLDVPAAWVAGWAGAGRPELVIRHEWRDPRIRVMEWRIDGGRARLVLDPRIWRYLRPLLLPGSGGTIRYAENRLGFLDEPGEWYLDEAAGRLHYFPLPGEESGTLGGWLGTTEELVVIEGGGVERPAGQIAFRGLTFADTTWLRPSDLSHMVSQANLVAEWDPVDFYERNVAPESRLPGAAIRIAHAAGVSFERCRWTRLGCAGLNLHAGSRDVRVEGCVFDGLGGAAMQIGEPGERDRNNVGPEDPRYLVRDVVVRNNFVTRAGQVYQGSVGVFVGFADTVTLSHNRLEDLPQSGFSVGWGWAWEIHTASRNHRIEFNRLRNVVNSDLNDGGAIYTLGAQPGTVVRANYVRHQTRNYSGLYPDIGTAFVRFADNVLRDMPYWLLIHDPSTTSNTFAGNWTSTRHASINDHRNRFSNQHYVDDGFWPAAALDIVRGAGLEASFADIQPRGIEWVNPMDRARTAVGRPVTLEAHVSGSPREIHAVRFLVDGEGVGLDFDGSDGWSRTWTGSTPGESTMVAEVEWVDGTRQRSEDVKVSVSGGEPGKTRVARTSAPGLWVIEAEDFAVNWRDEGYETEWGVERGIDSPAGVRGGAMRTGPETGWVLDPPWLEYSPRLEYPFRTADAAPLYVWLRLDSGAGGAGSAHVSLDGLGPVTIRAAAPGHGWTWCGTTLEGSRAVLLPRSGELHNLLVLMREDGLGLDTLVLSTSPDFRPDGMVLPLPMAVFEEERPVFRVQVGDLQAHESPIEHGRLSVVRSGPAGGGVVSIPSRTTGSATTGLDFVPLPSLIVFPPATSGEGDEVEVSIRPLADHEEEPEESVGLQLEAGAGYLLSWPAEGVVSLLDAGTSESATWKSARFPDPRAAEAADDADPDGDGWSNLLEESMDSDPRERGSDRGRAKVPRGWVADYGGRACFYLRYYRPFSGRQVPNLVYRVEARSDLDLDMAAGKWSEAVPEWVGMDVPEYLGGPYAGRFVRLRFPISTEPGAGGRRYYRVTVERR